MSVISIATAVGVDEFIRLMELHPVLFAGMSSAATVSQQQQRPFVFRYSWQYADRIGHETIATALFQAERAMESHLGFYLRPTPYTETLYRGVLGDAFWIQTDGSRQPLTTRWNHLRSGGTVSETVLSAGVNATVTGTTFTVTVSDVPATLDTSTVRVYFKESDRLGDPRGEGYRIRPVKVSLSGTTLTIRGEKWLLVKPSVLDTMTPDDNPPDADNANNYVTQVEVTYLSTVTTSPYVTIQWHASVEEAALSQTGIFVQTGSNQVIPHPATYASSAWTLQDISRDATPDSVTLSYVSGWTLDSNGNIERRLAQAVCWLAVGYLPDDFGSVVPGERVYSFWRESVVTSGDKIYSVPFSKADIEDNPFGGWRGAAVAWQIVKEYRQHGR